MIWKIALKWLTAGLISCLTVSGSVVAFDNVSLPIVNGTFGECNFQIQKTTITRIMLSSIPGVPNVKYPGGLFYNGTTLRGPIFPLLKSHLVACDLTDVEIMFTDGGNVHEDEDYYGIRFRATDPDDGLSYDYEWAIFGDVNTKIINTKVLHVDTTRSAVFSNENIGLIADGNPDAQGVELAGASKWVILFAALLSAIAFLFLLRYAYFFIKGLVYRRRSCSISASLFGDFQEFSGYVSIIGLDGVRFCPDSQTIGRQIQDLLKSEGFVEFDLEIAKANIPVFVDGYHKFYSPLYFIESITSTQLSNILRASTRKPEIVANIQHKTTRKKWHSKLEARKMSLRNIKKTRKM